ncbi:hypothetical protein [Sphingopyxis sp. UBA6723]|jgi:hypothetical protein|uniref:hypothetical protein n=1 Tax=Sphingopyxis sp. UBA6723 TaxID=1947538 RepID=UPI0025CBB87D|nr:hypothetical protein [Sphingopyxis sp. UBA6723]
MRQPTTFLSSLGVAALLLLPAHSSATDAHYEDREDAVVRAFLTGQLAKAKGRPVCFKPTLLAVHPDSITRLRNGPPEPKTRGSRAYARDLSVWTQVPRRILGEEREISISSDAWKALHARPATYGECRPLMQFTLHRVAIRRSTAMIHGNQGSACGSSSFGANVRAVDGRWSPVHWKGYYAVSGPPACGRLPISPELAAMPGYVMIGEPP